MSQSLLRVDAVGVGIEVLHACVDDIESVCLAKEHVELEEWFGCELGVCNQWTGLTFCTYCIHNTKHATITLIQVNLIVEGHIGIA